MESHGAHIIGVDGGGSTCRVAICTPDGTRIATASGPAANAATSLADAVRCILSTLEAARRDGGLNPTEIANASAYLGLAGVMNGKIARAVADAMPMRHAVVTDDRPTNMTGAMQDTDGFIAALGTGSFLGCQSGKAQRFVGGWGFWLGDQASGAWLGRLLLARILEWRDGLVPVSALLSDTFAGFDNDPSAIVQFAMTALPQDFAAYAPAILRAAEADDSAGRALMGDAAAYVQHGLDSLGFQHGDRLCLTGGIGQRFAPFLGAKFKANLTLPAGSALDGAIQLAMSLHALERGMAT